MKTPEQLKGVINNIAIQKALHSQKVHQIFPFERIPERLSFFSCRNHFILKDILLISSMLEISKRTKVA